MRENKRKNRDFEREKEELLEGRREQKGEREQTTQERKREPEQERYGDKGRERMREGLVGNWRTRKRN